MERDDLYHTINIVETKQIIMVEFPLVNRTIGVKVSVFPLSHN